MGGIMSLPEPFTWSWGQMIAFNSEALCGEDEHVHYEHTKLSLHDYARADMLSRMRGDWMLMLDTDHAFEPDLAARMVRTMMQYDVDILTGIYSYKAKPHFPVLYMFNHDTQKHEIIADWDRSLDILQVDSAGGGCLLVKRKVFEQITRELKESPFDRYPGKGEDHSFFTRCRKLGIKAYCAPKIELQHLAYWGIAPSTDYVRPAQVQNLYEVESFKSELAPV